MDAAEFFNSKNPSVFVMDDGPSGCKRSSIIRIRNEKKGMVSKSVETFTKPTPMTTPSRHHLHHQRPPPTMTSTTPRRMSARMGVATSVRVPTFVAPTATSSGVPTMTASATRRQTLTGIRTTPQQANRRTPIAVKTTSRIEPPKIVVSSRDEPIYANLNVAKRSTSVEKRDASTHKDVAPKSRLLSDRRHDRPVVNKRHETDEEKFQRKSKRLEGRRHLTIGYEGEVRSPLREKQNVMATVQRSKSAQTPKPKPTLAKKHADNSDDDIFSGFETASVLRSKSLRAASTEIQVPASLRETIYDITTPKSERVRRNLSDRVVTPRGCRNEAGPFIKTALTNSRVKGSTPMRGQRVAGLGASPTVRNSPRVLLNRY
jgi:hypothetical protein